MATAIDYLSTYMQDHRAGAEAGRDLAARLRDQNAGTPHEDFFVRLAEEISEDVATLESIMERFGVGKAVLKTAAAKVGESLGRLKANEHVASYSPLSRVLELEMLHSGVGGKLALWDSLHAVAGDDERLDGDMLAGLVQRAESQLADLREHHQMAAQEAFAGV